MEGIIAAAIGALGLSLPALIALGSAGWRQQAKIQREADLYNALPEELQIERDLARFLLQESLWSQATRRLRPFSVTAYFLLALMSGFVALIGIQFAAHGSLGLEDILEPKNDPRDSARLLGFSAFCLGLGGYLLALGIPTNSIRDRVKSLGGPPARRRQLIAAEASLAPSELFDVKFGTPRRTPTLTRQIVTLLRRGHTNPWDDLDTWAASKWPCAVAEPGVPPTKDDDPDPDGEPRDRA